MLVLDGIIGGQKNGVAGEGSFHGVERDLSFAFFGTGTGTELGVGLVGGEAGGFGELCKCCDLGVARRRGRLPHRGGGIEGEGRSGFIGFALSGAAFSGSCGYVSRNRNGPDAGVPSTEPGLP